MPPEAVPSNASVASTGKGLRYIGQHAYAYSGGVNVPASTDEPLLVFITGSGYIVARFQFTIHEKNYDDNSTFIVSLNDEAISFTETEDSETAGMDSPIILILPPFTKVKVTAFTTGSGDIDHGAMMTGRVYGAD